LGEVGGEFLEAGEVVDGEEIVNVGHGGLDTSSEGFVAGGAEQRVEPDEAVRTALEAGHFLAE
jgi:hypothetical protein